MINRNNFEINDSSHKMTAEGAEDDVMTREDIVNTLKAEGFDAHYINIWFDGLQNLWRWSCDIKISAKSCEKCKYMIIKKPTLDGCLKCTKLPISIDFITSNYQTFYCSEFERKD